MLFKTIYGPELQSIYEFIYINGPVEKDTLYGSYLPIIEGEMGPRANLDDAITFLVSSGLINRNNLGKYEAVGSPVGNFKVHLLRNLRNIQVGSQTTSHPMDPWYLELVERIFILPNRLVGFKLHQTANSIDAPEVFSEEKINAWRRVIEYLGLGGRIASGFMCCYKPELISEIIDMWDEDEGPVQLLLEEHLSKYLPWQNEGGDISQSLIIPLLILAKEGLISLEQKQDLPYKSYLGDMSIKWIRKGEGLKNAPMYQRK
ncbi:hypothetical protein JCM14036_12460 [Desulfotomaculum defluvii]